jgi:hypothetical protein
MYFFRTFKKSIEPYKVHNMGLRYINTTVYVPSSELGLPQPVSRKRVCPSPNQRVGGVAHSPAGEGLGESQFRRLEKKLSEFLLLGAGAGDVLYSVHLTVIPLTHQWPCTAGGKGHLRWPSLPQPTLAEITIYQHPSPPFPNSNPCSFFSSHLSAVFY